MPDAIAWVDEIAPERAVSVCGAKMGRLAELLEAGVSLPKGFTVTVDAYRRHWARGRLGRPRRRRPRRARPRCRARRDRGGRASGPCRSDQPGHQRGTGRADRRRLRGAEFPLLRDQRPDRGAQLGHWRGFRLGQLRRDLRHLPRGVGPGPGARGRPPMLGQPVQRARGGLPACGPARTTGTCRWRSASSS